jgi:hypothetical protein
LAPGFASQNIINSDVNPYSVSRHGASEGMPLPLYEIPLYAAPKIRRDF